MYDDWVIGFLLRWGWFVLPVLVILLIFLLFFLMTR